MSGHQKDEMTAQETAFYAAVEHYYQSTGKTLSKTEQQALQVLKAELAKPGQSAVESLTASLEQMLQQHEAQRKQLVEVKVDVVAKSVYAYADAVDEGARRMVDAELALKKKPSPSEQKALKQEQQRAQKLLDATAPQSEKNKQMLKDLVELEQRFAVQNEQDRSEVAVPTVGTLAVKAGLGSSSPKR